MIEGIRRQKIIQMKVEGEIDTRIAENLGLTRRQVSFFLNKEEVKQSIEKLQRDFYLKRIPTAYKRIKDLIEKDPSKIDSWSEKSKQIDVSMKALEAAGIIGNSPSSVIQKLTQINILTSDESRQLINTHLKNLISFKGGENGKKKEG